MARKTAPGPSSAASGANDRGGAAPRLPSAQQPCSCAKHRASALGESWPGRGWVCRASVQCVVEAQGVSGKLRAPRMVCWGSFRRPAWGAGEARGVSGTGGGPQPARPGRLGSRASPATRALRSAARPPACARRRAPTSARETHMPGSGAPPPREPAPARRGRAAAHGPASTWVRGEIEVASPPRDECGGEGARLPDGTEVRAVALH